jgi:uncharacterized protein YndB with AHSA1/START domain
MPTLEEKVEIAVSAERIFARLADAERGPEWTPSLVRVERTSAVESGPGLQTSLIVKVAGHETKGTGRCLEWEPSRRLVLDAKLDGGVSATTTFGLAENGSGTDVTARIDYTLPSRGLGRFLGALMGEPMARRDLRQALANLKAQLEAEAAARPPETRSSRRTTAS